MKKKKEKEKEKSEEDMKIPMPVETKEYPWLTIAKGEIGVKEIRGPRNNPRVVKYGEAVDYQVKNDKLP